MNPFFSKTVWLNPLVLGSIVLAAAVAAGSAWYYAAHARPPALLPALTAPTAPQAITASGVVEPAQNPNLAFVSGGRVAALNVAVGSRVYAGELLASLDTATLSAQRAQAAANVDAAQAKLDGMLAGPRQVDVTAKQTALAQAQAALANTYSSVAVSVQSAYDQSFSGVSSDTDSLFNEPDSPSPTLVFSTINPQLGLNASGDRVTSNNELAAWSTQAAALSAGSSPASLDAALADSLGHLLSLRTYANALLSALNNAAPGSMSATDVAAAQTSVGGLRDTLNSLISTLQGVQQAITTQKLAVKAAQDALNQTLAGATAQDIEAQRAAVEAAKASVASLNAQLANAQITAPFAGTVSSVQVKVGDIIAPNTTALTLNPASALQVTAYLSEADAGRVAAGQPADITLDAYGSSRHFTATVVSVDTSPTERAGVPAYRLVLQFASSSPAISAGMTANITITPAH